jgi:hypothetical protein
MSELGTFVYIGRDGPRGAELRKSVRDEHIAHLEPLDAQGRILFAGPLRDDDGAPCGSVIVFKAADLAEAKRIGLGDPYLVKGVFDRVEVHESLKVFPRGDG